MPVSKYARRLPDAFRKDPESVNARLLSLDGEDVEALLRDIRDVDAALDLFAASGATLDLYGDMVGQKRGRLNDEQYRYLILTKIGRNNVRGDYDSILGSIVQMFNCGPEDVALDDVELTEEDAPCTVHLSKMPIAVLVGAGFTSRQAVSMIEALMPVCVRLTADNFEGTFCFADGPDEYNETAGFADDAQTLGGYLGLLYGEDGEIPLPL